MSPHIHHSHGPHDHRAGDSTSGSGGLPLLLDLDAEVLAAHLDAVRTDIASLVDAPVRAILDVGAGTGTGTFGLLQRFAGSHAVAVDGSADMLDRLRHTAERLRLSDRVTTVQLDLDDGVPDLEPVDVAWASGSLHHLADPDRTLTNVRNALRPGGLLAVVELTGHPRFLPDDSAGGAVEAQAHALLATDRAADLPAMGSNWGQRLTRSGFVVELERSIIVDLAPPPGGRAGEYALATLTRIRDAVADRLDSASAAQLDQLLDGGPHDVRQRHDLRITTERQLWIARRPVR